MAFEARAQTTVVITPATLPYLESAESHAFSSANITRSSSHTLDLNPAVDEGTTDSGRNIFVSTAITPNVQGLSDAFIIAAQGVYGVPSADLSFSLGASRLGYSSVYSNTDGFLGASKIFRLADGRTASAGVRFRYETVNSNPASPAPSPYPPVHFDMIDLGFTFDLSQEFIFGASALNLLGSGYTTTQGEVEKVPAVFLLGLSYLPGDGSFGVHAAGEYEDGGTMTMRIGVEYSPVDLLVLRLGTWTYNGTYTAGIGLKYDKLILDVAANFDPTYGLITTFGITGRW